jgi:hypothetical protein
MGWCLNALCRGIVYLFQAPKGKEVTHSIPDSIPVMSGFQFKSVFCFLAILRTSWEPAENHTGSPNKRRPFPIPSLPFPMVGVWGHNQHAEPGRNRLCNLFPVLRNAQGRKNQRHHEMTGWQAALACGIMWGFLNERYHSVKAEHLLCHLHQYGWFFGNQIWWSRLSFIETPATKWAKTVWPTCKNRAERFLQSLVGLIPRIQKFVPNISKHYIHVFCHLLFSSFFFPVFWIPHPDGLDALSPQFSTKNADFWWVHLFLSWKIDIAFYSPEIQCSKDVESIFAGFITALLY